ADHHPSYPPVPDDRGEQDRMCPTVPPQVVESRARTPTLPDGESIGELEPADAEPQFYRAAASVRANFQYNIGHRRYRRSCDTNDEEDCSRIIGSDAKQGKDKDTVQLLQRKRRRVNTSAPITHRTAPKRQVHLRYTNSLSL
ncbi:hypothetical protein C8A01DRAFT_14767, partial [Parachaetomium inaequale]